MAVTYSLVFLCLTTFLSFFKMQFFKKQSNYTKMAQFFYHAIPTRYGKNFRVTLHPLQTVLRKIFLLDNKAVSLMWMLFFFLSSLRRYSE